VSGLRLLLVSRDDLLGLMESGSNDRAFRLLASLTRQGYRLVATAPQPEQWTGEHGTPDDALLGPNSIRKRVSEAGGTLDGVYYVRRSLLTQKRNREDALHDILKRYAARPEHAVLLSSKRNFVKAAENLGFHAILLDRDHPLQDELSQLNDSGLSEA